MLIWDRGSALALWLLLLLLLLLQLLCREQHPLQRIELGQWCVHRVLPKQVITYGRSFLLLNLDLRLSQGALRHRECLLSLNRNSVRHSYIGHFLQCNVNWIVNALISIRSALISIISMLLLCILLLSWTGRLEWHLLRLLQGAHGVVVGVCCLLGRWVVRHDGLLLEVLGWHPWYLVGKLFVAHAYAAWISNALSPDVIDGARRGFLLWRHHSVSYVLAGLYWASLANIGITTNCLVHGTAAR